MKSQLLSSVGGASLKFSSLKSQLPESPKTKYLNTSMMIAVLRARVHLGHERIETREANGLQQRKAAALGADAGARRMQNAECRPRRRRWRPATFMCSAAATAGLL
eukprot:SAG25_NODE_4678_length_769_cov_0.649254_2_plen_105_part_01